MLIDVLQNGRNVLRTAFPDSYGAIDNWIKRDGFKALTSPEAGESGFPDNRLTLRIIRQSLEESQSGKNRLSARTYSVDAAAGDPAQADEAMVGAQRMQAGERG